MEVHSPCRTDRPGAAALRVEQGGEHAAAVEPGQAAPVDGAIEADQRRSPHVADQAVARDRLRILHRHKYKGDGRGSCIDCDADPPSSTSSRRVDAPPQLPAATALGLGLLLACRPRAPDGVALVGATLIDGTAVRRWRRPRWWSVPGPHRVGRARGAASGCPNGRPKWTSPAVGSCRAWWTPTCTVDLWRESPVGAAPVSRLGRDDRAGPARRPR